MKTVVIGGSVAAWQRGNFGQVLQVACDRIEVINKARSKLGALDLKRRFVHQVLKNRRLDLQAHEEVWLVFMGGLNSVYSPERTNRLVAATYRRAHEGGLKVMGLTVAPWGAAYDRRWKGLGGWRYLVRTRRIVDYVLGRLNQGDAFGDKAPSPLEAVDALDLPDIAVDLYHSPLRAADAPIRDDAKTRRLLGRSRAFRKEIEGLSEEAKEAATEERVASIRRIPQWYLRKDLQAFDHIHPNQEGHGIIARLACEKAPPSWGCECERIDRLTWDRKARGLVLTTSPQGQPEPPAPPGSGGLPGTASSPRGHDRGPPAP